MNLQTVRKNSRKRQALLDALCRTKEHPSAETLYMQLKDEFPELSLGTVYRNLGVLCQEGLITSVGHVNGQLRYDAVVEPHPHFVCRGCHRIIDLDMPDTISGMFRQIEDNFRLDCQSYNLSIEGLCPGCR